VIVFCHVWSRRKMSVRGNRQGIKSQKSPFFNKLEAFLCGMMLLLCVSCGALSGLVPVASKTISPEGSDFSLVYPAGFRLVPKTDSLIDFGEESAVSSTFNATRLAKGVSLITVIVSDLSNTKILKNKSSTDLFNLLAERVRRNSGQITSQKEITSPGSQKHQSLRVEGVRDQEKFYGRVDYLLDKNKLYQIIYTVKEAKDLESDEVKTFFDSFKRKA
jgi:hypothetical protein